MTGTPLPVRDLESPRARTGTEDMGTDDASLLHEAVADPDGPAFTELYRRHARRIYGLGRRLLGDPALAEELVQESFVRLWRHADRYDPARGTVRALLTTIARSVAVDLWRRPSSRPLDPDAGPDRAAPGDAVDSLLIALTVREALDHLSPAHREVLELSYPGDLTQADIAEQLGIPLGTVKTRTFHALKALRRTLLDAGMAP
jgi:RNA polymerase sigma-70 factor (ECF subfamily)